MITSFRRASRILAGALGVLVCAGVEGSAVQVSAQAVGGTTLQIGEVGTIAVKAEVQDAASPQDGIFTFDLDLLLAHLAGEVPNLTIVSVSRSGVNDLMFGGSDGTPASEGVLSIYGGYEDMSRGLANPVVLLTATVRGEAVGQSSVSAGPSVTPYGSDFVLWETDSPAVTYGPALVFTVVPEPRACVTALAGMGLALWRRQRGRQAKAERRGLGSIQRGAADRH